MIALIGMRQHCHLPRLINGADPSMALPTGELGDDGGQVLRLLKRFVRGRTA